MSDARPDHPAPGRALLGVALAAVVCAIVLAALAFRAPESDAIVLDVTPVTAPEPPDTLPLLPAPSSVPRSAATAPPVVPAAPTPSVGGAAAPNSTTSTTPVPTTTEPPDERSPLADLLGVPGSAIPPAIEPRVPPRSVTIDDIELWGPVRAVGLEDDGELEIPDETEIGWYRYGSSPGRPGATVLAAHVSWNGTVGPFHQLGKLEPGAAIDVRLDDGTLRTYEVVERTMYDKDDLPRAKIWRTTGDETLVLITCGGSFNPDINRYRQNIVVYAVPVAHEDPVTS